MRAICSRRWASARLTDPDLTVVIPAYNEVERLSPTLDRIGAYLDQRERSFEVVVVDDGSTDETASLVRDHAKRNSRISLLELGRNRGKGAAVRAGVLAAAGRLVLISDADLSTPIEELTKLEAALEAGSDIAIGSRGLAAADIQVRQPRYREAMGRIFNLIVRTLTPGTYRDTQCGFKLLTRAAAHDLFGRSTVDRFAFDVEILQLAEGRYQVAEIPVVWRHVEESRVSPLVDAPRMLFDLVKLALRRRS